MASLPELFKKTGETLSNIEPRPFDRFILGPFLVWYGLQSKSMGRWPRRVLIAGGLYQLLYAYKEYQKLYGAIKEGPRDALAVITNKKDGDATELIL